MKRATLVFALVIGTCKLNSQPYYGEVLHDQNQSVELTTGTRLSAVVQSGFLLGGSIPNSTMNGPNFIINKLSVDGTFNNLNGFFPDFSKAYQIFGNSGCSNTPPPITNCAGISASEFFVSTLNTFVYMVAGAFDEGCFLVSLDMNGNVVNQSLFTFPPTSSQASKPILVRFNAFMYIIGSFESTLFNSRQMYILKVDVNLNVIQSVTYNMAKLCGNPFDPNLCSCGPNEGGYDLTPKDAILSPFPSAFGAGVNEIIVVGEAKKYGLWGSSCSLSNESSGFLLRLRAINLNVLSCSLYDYGAGINGFTSIDAAPSTQVAGFIIGGHSDINQGFGRSWMMKVDKTSALPLWSKILSSTYGNVASMVTDVGYRDSPNYGDTYYGVVNNGNGGVVVKLDANGSPFGCNPCISAQDNVNEFNYLLTGQSSPNSKIITINPNTGVNQNNPGIQVYGNGSSSEFFLSRATFNGDSNFGTCNSSTSNTALQSNPGPMNVIAKPVNPTPPNMLVHCSNFNVTATNISPTSNTPCQLSGMPSNGSNNKTVNTNSFDKEIENEYLVLPNPSNGKLTVSSSNDKELLKVRVMDVTGKLMFSFEFSTNDSKTIDISSLKASLYLIEIENQAGQIVRKKLVKE